MIIEEASWNELAEYREALEHVNRKGSRWYQHIFGKFQRHAKYAAGMSAPSDKKTSKRADDDAKAKAKAEKKAADDKEKAEKKEADAKVKAEKKRQEILSDPKKLYKHRKEYSYDEIKKALERFKQESELNKYSQETLQRGSNFIKTMNSYANNAINLYNSAARIVNTFRDNGESNYLPFIGNIDTSKNKAQVRQKKADDALKKYEEKKAADDKAKTEKKAADAKVKADNAATKAQAKAAEKAEKKEAKAQARAESYERYLDNVDFLIEEIKKRKKSKK